MTGSYTSEQRTSFTWEQFYEMFRIRYLPLVERERLTQKYLDLRQTTESVKEIAKMLIETTLFLPGFDSKVPATKRFKAPDTWFGGQRGHSCRKCEKSHGGLCRLAIGCDKCDKEGNYATHYHQQEPIPSSMICYHCDQVVHGKAQCLWLCSRPVQESIPTNLRIKDGRHGREEAPKASGHGFHLHVGGG